MKEFTLGLDIGIGSVGWALIDQEEGKLIDMGVRLFEEAKPAADPRKNRSARRTLRRKKWRKQQLKDAFDDFGILSKTEINKEGFLSFTTDTEEIPRPQDETVHHLRQRAIREKVTKRELFLALYNICGTRGHFLLENIDFSRETITYDLFKEKFYQLVEPYVSFDENIKDFEKQILNVIFEKGMGSRDLKNALKDDYTVDPESKDALTNICTLLAGYKANLEKISESVLIPEAPVSMKVDDLVKREDLNDFCNDVVELYDLINVHKILKEYEYICDSNVAKLKNVVSIQKMEIEDPTKYKEEVKKIQSKMNGKLGNRLRVIRNLENKFPNGLYVKEAVAILKNQQKYYPEITNEFIEVCSTIISARIPYYIGPLSPDAKNAWLTKTGKFKYSYEYSKKNSVDEYESIQKWKKAMISHCTYLPDEYALPKGSFIGETFNILNELNILLATEQTGEIYNLKTTDKVKIFDELFLKGNKVTYKDIADLLDLYSFGTKSGETKKKFNNQYSLYLAITNVLPELKLDTIEELFTNPDKINKLEDIILNINLFDEEVSKKEYFMTREGFDEKTASKLAKLKSKNFYSFSKKFIMNTGMNEQQDSLLTMLFSDNTDSYTNEQMTLIQNAVDKDGEPLNFESNKYLKKLNKDSKLSVDLLIENGKPFIPISRPVIRALNECFKLYEEVIKVYGVPKRVVVETARELKDTSQKKEAPAKHFAKMDACYKDIQKQVKEQKNKNILLKESLAEWEEVEAHLAKNKRKIELYIRQNGQDMISGDPIDINHLENYEMDHILPRGFGDDSMDNLMLIHKDYNAKKKDRIPLEYIESEAVLSKSGNQVTTKQFKARVHALFDIKAISEKKQNQLLLASTEEAMGFINRNLVDTRYIIREFMSVLRAYNQVKDYDTHIVALQAAFTSVYRNAFNIKKNRDIGDQHHALDAATVAVTDKVLNAYYPNYDRHGNMKQYQAFLKQLKESNVMEGNEKQKLNTFIRQAYHKAYGNYPNDNDSLIAEIKNTIPLYSVKVEKNYKGEFFNATLYSPKNKKGKPGPLDVLGVNNDKRVFSSINCVAVDFYKYTDKKGHRKHAAIHIPKVIVDNNGNINKEMYIKLIKDYYKIPELLDENGDIKTYYYRFRAFKNDLIYDTENYTIQKFNIGSIVNVKLEMKHIYVFSYNEIYKLVHFYHKALAVHFDFKLGKINPNGQKKFSDYNIDEIINFCLDNLMEIEDHKRYDQTIRKVLKEEKQLYSFLEKTAYLNLIVNRNCTPPTITGQYLPTANTVDSEAEYIKLKYSPLGIRYQYNDQGKLKISGPKKKPGMYSKIKKEPFSWKMSKEVL